MYLLILNINKPLQNLILSTHEPFSGMVFDQQLKLYHLNYIYLLINVPDTGLISSSIAPLFFCCLLLFLAFWSTHIKSSIFLFLSSSNRLCEDSPFVRGKGWKGCCIWAGEEWDEYRFCCLACSYIIINQRLWFIFQDCS